MEENKFVGKLHVSFTDEFETTTIDKEYHDSIFNRFGQVYNETNEEMGGSGLGLTLTKNLINLHGGEITVISEKGQGSEFIITLPLK